MRLPPMNPTIPPLWIPLLCSRPGLRLRPPDSRIHTLRRPILAVRWPSVHDPGRDRSRNDAARANMSGSAAAAAEETSAADACGGAGAACIAGKNVPCVCPVVVSSVITIVYRVFVSSPILGLCCGRPFRVRIDRFPSLLVLPANANAPRRTPTATRGHAPSIEISIQNADCERSGGSLS